MTEPQNESPFAAPARRHLTAGEINNAFLFLREIAPEALHHPDTAALFQWASATASALADYHRDMSTIRGAKAVTQRSQRLTLVVRQLDELSHTAQAIAALLRLDEASLKRRLRMVATDRLHEAREAQERQERRAWH